MRDRLVIAIGFFARSGIPLQRAGKLLQRLQNRISAKIGKRQSHMVSVMEGIFGIGFKTVDQLFVAHLNCLAGWTAGPGSRLEALIPFSDRDCPGCTCRESSGSRLPAR